MGIVIMIAIWIVIGLLAAMVADSIWEEPRPLNETWRYVVSILTTVVVGVGDWYILPLIGIEGILKFVISILEPAASALIVLWVIRLIGKRKS